MKKILFLTILIVLILSIFLIKPKLILADTPDSFLMNELYLFNYDTFNLEPNFENGYLMKTTILPTDVNDDNTSGFFSWYQNLGYNNLIIPYYGENDNQYVVLGIPLNGIIANNFQLAYSVSSPTQLYFYLIFTDGTYQEWDTEQVGFGSQFLEILSSNRTKNCYAFCWEAYSPDYVPSFKFLGVTEGYELGYQNGFSKGKSEGYTLGRISGYNYGFQDGITNTNEVVYDKVLNFNQLIKNGNFETTENWNVSSGDISASDNVLTFSSNQISAVFQTGTIESNHKYYFRSIVNTDNTNMNVGLYKNSVSWQYRNISGGQLNTDLKIDFVFDSGQTLTTDVFDVRFRFNSAAEHTARISNAILIDLTKMYGEGYEPTLAVCQQIFVNNYYDYTLSKLVDIGYFTGFYDGKNEGIQEGINIGETNQINMGWIQSIFQAMQGFFNIQIFPHVTLGIIVGIPFIISLAWFVIKMFRGGGGGDE